MSTSVSRNNNTSTTPSAASTTAATTNANGVKLNRRQVPPAHYLKHPCQHFVRGSCKYATEEECGFKHVVCTEEMLTGQDLKFKAASMKKSTGDWGCVGPDCSFQNFSRRAVCARCGAPRPVTATSTATGSTTASEPSTTQQVQLSWLNANSQSFIPFDLQKQQQQQQQQQQQEPRESGSAVSGGPHDNREANALNKQHNKAAQEHQQQEQDQDQEQPQPQPQQSQQQPYPIPPPYPHQDASEQPHKDHPYPPYPTSNAYYPTRAPTPSPFPPHFFSPRHLGYHPPQSRAFHRLPAPHDRDFIRTPSSVEDPSLTPTTMTGSISHAVPPSGSSSFHSPHHTHTSDLQPSNPTTDLRTPTSSDNDSATSNSNNPSTQELHMQIIALQHQVHDIHRQFAHFRHRQDQYNDHLLKEIYELKQSNWRMHTAFEQHKITLPAPTAAGDQSSTFPPNTNTNTDVGGINHNAHPFDPLAPWGGLHLPFSTMATFGVNPDGSYDDPNDLTGALSHTKSSSSMHHNMSPELDMQNIEQNGATTHSGIFPHLSTSMHPLPMSTTPSPHDHTATTTATISLFPHSPTLSQQPSSISILNSPPPPLPLNDPHTWVPHFAGGL